MYSTTQKVDVVIYEAQSVHTRVELDVYRVVLTVGTVYRTAELV